MPRKTFKPDRTDPKFQEFIAEMTGMAEVGDWLTLAGYSGKDLYEVREEIIKICEVITVKGNYLISGTEVTGFLREKKESGG